ncbi:MAG: hypothetical protein IJR40_03855 [Treponema sp.]|nr:hypothetical protein [Treponema sp.]
MMKTKKVFFAALLAALALNFLQAQEAAGGNSSQEQNARQAQEAASSAHGGFQNLFGGSFVAPKSAKEFWSQVSPFVNLGANITLNTESKLKSAPSPTAFAFAVGGIWPNKAFLSFQPRLSFWWSYYLWDGKNALPAEIENRTAFVLNFMLDLPAAATFRFQKFQIEAGAGLGILARAAMLAGGVGEGDTGASGSAGGDKSEIQKWFWSNARFLYTEFFGAWEWNFTDRIAAGFELRYYLPVGSLADGRGLTESIFALSAKLIF